MFTLAHEAYDRGLAAARDHRAILREDMDRALAEAARGGADPGVAQHPVGRHDARDAQRVVETLPPPRRPNATASRRHEIREDREHARADRYAFLGAHPQHHATVWRWRAAARRRAGPSAPHPAPATARHARVRRGHVGRCGPKPVRHLLATAQRRHDAEHQLPRIGRDHADLADVPPCDSTSTARSSVSIRA